MTDGLRGELAWHQSSTCEGGACAEVAATDDVVMVRNPANPCDTPVTLSHAEWQGFLAAVKEGTFDRLLLAC
jgi:Domain of unknown function (DUF397)